MNEQVGGDHYHGDWLIDAMRHIKVDNAAEGYCVSSILRYVTRHKEKNGLQDLQKAVHCTLLLMRECYGEDKVEQVMEIVRKEEEKHSQKNI